MARRHLGTYLAVSVIWGCTWFFILHVVRAFGGGGVALRAVIGAAVLLIAARASGKRLQFGPLGPVVVLGATSVAAQFMGFNLATPMVGTSVTAIFAATIPMFAMVIGHAWHLERITPTGFLGLALGLLGVVFIVGFPSVAIDATFIVGCLLCVIGGVGAAYGSNYARRSLQGIGYWEQTIGSFLTGGVMMLPLFVIDPPNAMPQPIDYFYLAVLAVISTGIGYVLYFKLVAEIGASSASSVEFLVTGIAVAIGAGFLGETLTHFQFVGLGLVMLGCVLVLDLVPRRRRASGVQ